MYLYRNAHTFFHELHPLTKLVFLTALITIAFFAQTLLMSSIVLAVYFFLLLMAGGLSNFLKLWKMFVWFWVLAFLMWMVVPALRGQPWSTQNSAMLANRIAGFLLSSLLFVTTTRIEEFTYALTRIGIPYKGAFALSLGFRLVPLFYQNLRTILEAQKSRGLDIENASLIQKGKLYLPVIGILISYGLRNADIMAMALEAKGFGYSSRRTSYLQPVFTLRDLWILIFIVIILFLEVR